MITRQRSRIAPVRITVPLGGRSIIRAPFLIDMRSRLASHCTPQWEPRSDVWTVPRGVLRPVIDVVLAAFGQACVSIEVRREVSGSGSAVGV